MALPTTGAITLGMVAVELGISLPLSLGDARVRALAGKPTGAITLGDLRGKSAYTPPSIVCDTYVQEHSFASNGLSAYVDRAFYFQINGGEAPFTVVWNRVSGFGTISVFGGASPTASANGTAPFSYSAVFRATVTDARNSQTTSPDISIQLSAGQDIT